MKTRCYALGFLALLLVACSSNDDDDGAVGPGGSDDDYQRCVDRINAFRATEGLPALRRDSSSERCADSQCQSDSQSGDAHGAFGECDEWAQNECPGWGSIDEVIEGCLQSMWDEGPGGGHYENMSSRDYEEVFCGFYTTSGGDVWAIQDFR
jgi:hypothetical protein